MSENRFTENEKKAFEIIDEMIQSMPICFWEEMSDGEEIGEAW